MSEGAASRDKSGSGSSVIDKPSEIEASADEFAAEGQQSSVASSGASADDRASSRPVRRSMDPTTLLPAPLPARRSPSQQPQQPEVADVFPPVANAALPPLPGRRRRRRFGTTFSFVLFVLIPTALFALYMYNLAPSQFTSEFRFSVSQGNPILPGSTTSTTTPGTSGSALSSLVSAMGSGSNVASPQNFVVTDYLTSRQAIDDLERKVHIRSMYQKSSIPKWERFDASKSAEDFVRYSRDYLYANYDQVTGLAVARVRAYSAEDAGAIAKSLSDLSEKLVNDLNARANNDAIRFAQDEVDKMEEKLTVVNAQLLKYRNSEGTINPNNAAVPINVMLVQTLESSLLNLQTQLEAARQQGVRSDAPTMKSLHSQISSTELQMKSVKAQIARDSSRTRALAKIVGSYEDLIFNQQYLETMVVQVRQALVLAKAYAAAQHLYLVPYVNPSKPESSDYPNRPLNVLLGAIVFFGIWFGTLMIYKSIRDHAY